MYNITFVFASKKLSFINKPWASYKTKNREKKTRLNIYCFFNLLILISLG